MNFLPEEYEEELKLAFEVTKVSCHLLVFNIEAAKTFIQNPTFIQEIEKRYGVIKEEDATNFVKKINATTSNIQSYKDLLHFLGLEKVYPDNQSIKKLLDNSSMLSKAQGYTFDKVQYQKVKFEEENFEEVKIYVKKNDPEFSNLQ